MKFKKIIIIGTGSLFKKCLEYVNQLNVLYVGYDMSDKPSKMMEMWAEKNQIQYIRKNKKEVFANVYGEKEELLLLSVINPCIVPKEILEKNNITALNCHQALLPKHKGRNAEAWAIYDGDTITGITWHRMTAEVDGGDILIQKMLPIKETSTSFGLFREQMQIAYEAFLEFMPQILNGTERYYPQGQTETDFRYSWEKPGNARINIAWNGEQISRFLRAMDYGGLFVLGKPSIEINGCIYEYRRYNIARKNENSNGDSIVVEGDTIDIYRQKYKIQLLSCTCVSGNNGK